jgi:hypothetical protein
VTAREGQVSTFALDVFAVSGRASDPELAAHVDGCARCRTYLASLDALEASAPPLRLPTAPPRRRWLPPAAFALALAAGIALFVATRAPTRDDYVGVKGTPAIQLLVHRERTTRIWDGRTPLRPGDTLALRVACEGMKHVAVAAPAPTEWAALSRAACVDGDAPLPFTLRVDDAPGDEKLAVVLSRDELGDDALREVIAQGRRTADVWVVSFVLPKEVEKSP